MHRLGLVDKSELRRIYGEMYNKASDYIKEIEEAVKDPKMTDRERETLSDNAYDLSEFLKEIDSIMVNGRAYFFLT